MNSMKVELIDKTSNQQYVLPLKGGYTLGRNQKNDVVIGYNRSVSGSHCEFVLINNQFCVIDSDSTNGTYVNGERVTKKHIIEDGDELQVGLVKFEVKFLEE